MVKKSFPHAVSDTKNQIVLTFVYFLSFLGLGLVNASFGPALPHLARHVNTTIAGISNLFVAHRLGYLIGAFFGGRLFDRIQGNALMSLLLVSMCATAILIPAAPILWMLLGLCFVSGTMGGAINVGGNILLIWMSPKRLGSLIIILHIFYGAGAFLSPILITQAIRWTGDINWGYGMLTVFLLPVAGYLFWFSSPIAKSSSDDIRPISINYLLPILITLFLLLDLGAEISFGGWIYTYAIEMRLTDQINAGYLTSAYWGSFTLGRMISALLAVRIRPRILLSASLFGSLLSLAMILIWPDHLVPVWIGTLGFGFTMGPILPAVITMASNTIQMSGTITGMFYMGSSLGAMSLPWIIGQLISHLGPAVIIACIFFSLFLASVLFLGILKISIK
jgi:FHS family Na+ dependent glucose MFS transporter 1